MTFRTKIAALAMALFAFGSITESAQAQVRAQITIGSSPYRTPVYRYYHSGRYYQRPYSYYYTTPYYGYRRHDNGWHRGWYNHDRGYNDDHRDWDNRNYDGRKDWNNNGRWNHHEHDK